MILGLLIFMLFISGLCVFGCSVLKISYGYAAFVIVFFLFLCFAIVFLRKSPDTKLSDNTTVSDIIEPSTTTENNEIPEDNKSLQDVSDLQEPASGQVNDIETETFNDSLAEATILEQVIYDQDNIRVTVTGLNLQGLLGPELNLFIENNTDINLEFQARDTAINNYMIDSSMSDTCASGKSVNGGITFLKSDLEKSNIENIADIEFTLHYFNYDDLSDDIDSDLIHLRTNIADTVDQQYDDSGTLVFDYDGIKIVCKGIETDDSILGPTVLFYIENNTDYKKTVQARNCSINNLMIEPSFSAEILSGKKIISGMTFLSSDLEENNITDITSLELSFHIFEDYFDEYAIDSDPVLIDFN